MMEQNVYMTKRLRQAGGLIVGALLVQAASLGWNHPLSFLVFVAAAGLMGLGMVIYLFAILSSVRQQDTPKGKEIRKEVGVI
jgi:hypothetical protein